MGALCVKGIDGHELQMPPVDSLMFPVRACVLVPVHLLP